MRLGLVEEAVDVGTLVVGEVPTFNGGLEGLSVWDAIQ
jgi:hypothetical protein